MVQMTPLQSAIAGKLTDEKIAERITQKAVEAMYEAQIPKDVMVTWLLAWARSVARSTGDIDFWSEAFQRTAESVKEPLEGEDYGD